VATSSSQRPVRKKRNLGLLKCFSQPVNQNHVFEQEKEEQSLKLKRILNEIMKE
jgi:hypothetical protein